MSTRYAAPCTCISLTGTASCRRARKKAQIQQLQVEVAIQKYVNAILTHKLEEREAQVQGNLSEKASELAGGIPESSPLAHNTIAADCKCNGL